MSVNYVYLKCVKEKSRLRVKIISNGYNNNANCQFPKAIRKEGQQYKVPDYAITVVQRGTNKFFYHVNKSKIELIYDENVKPDNIYESVECCICMDEECNIVMVPCGHLCMCSGCSEEYQPPKCPMCRANVVIRIDKSKLQ